MSPRGAAPRRLWRCIDVGLHSSHVGVHRFRGQATPRPVGDAGDDVPALPGGLAYHTAGGAAFLGTDRRQTQTDRPGNSPIFLRHSVRNYTPARIELSPQFVEIERPPEKFNYTYLPEQVEIMFREALACYSNGSLNAFVTMCRRAMQAVFAQGGEAARLRMFDELNEVRDMAEIDADSFAAIRRVVFGTDADPLRAAAGDHEGSAVRNLRPQRAPAAGDGRAAFLFR
jgi:hypothetical protein